MSPTAGNLLQSEEHAVARPHGPSSVRRGWRVFRTGVAFSVFGLGAMAITERLAPQITACTDGPLLVRGAVDIVGDDGEALHSRRRTVALCRCGASGIKPWCDGTHKLIRFSTADHPPVGDD